MKIKITTVGVWNRTFLLIIKRFGYGRCTYWKGEQAIKTLASKPLEVCDSSWGFLKWGQAS